jgi:hypothetical protein
MVLTPAVGLIGVKDLLIVPFRRSSEGELKVTSAGREIEHSAVSKDDGVAIQFSETVEVDSNKPLVVQA